MSETVTPIAPTAPVAEVVEPVVTPPVVAEPVEGEAELGDAGKRALDAMKTERNAARAEAKASKAETDRLIAEIANKDKPAEEQALEAARAEARTEATAKANERIVRAEVKAAATGKVKNPAIALKLIDVSAIEVDEDGEVDSDALDQAITGLLTAYPELAADGSKFGGSADQGAKGKTSKVSQISRSELASMSPAQIEEARLGGRLTDLLSGKTK